MAGEPDGQQTLTAWVHAVHDSFGYNVWMGSVIHTSKIRIYQDEPPERRAFVTGFEEPLEFGVHGGIKHFYGMEPKRDLPATLDHMIAAVGG